MGIESFPPGASTTPTVIYGASAIPVVSLSGTAYDSAASLTFSTTATNTKWLVEVDADVNYGSSNGSAALKVKVDGSYVATTGSLDQTFATNAGGFPTRQTIRGRIVVTLATAASHTLIAAATGNASTTLQTVAITATQVN